MAPTLSVVIPTLNAAGTLDRTLSALAAGGRGDEIVVADGGSADGTREIAVAHGARIVAGARGRGPQLAAGAAAAAGDWLLFLHADTVLPRDWRAVVDRFCADPANADRAGYFRLRLDSAARAARRVERLAAWRARVLGLPYGDQGLLVARALYDAVGGHPPLVLMEDVALARRLGRRRLVALPADALTSAARYRRDGWWLRPARNLLCLALYFAGLPPHLIRRLYA